MLKCRTVMGENELARLAPAWDALVSRCDSDTVFATSGFALAWWRAYHEGRALRVLVVEEGTTPRLIAPLYTHVSSPRVLRLIGEFRADYNAVLVGRGDSEAVKFFFEHLLTLKDWDEFRARRVPGDSLLLRHFPSPLESGMSRGERVRRWLCFGRLLAQQAWHYEHPRIERAALESQHELLGEYSYRRQVQWFSKNADFQYRRTNDPAECLHWLPAFFDLHRSNWASKGQPSLFDSVENRRFYEHLVNELGPTGAVRLDSLCADGVLIAAHFGFEYANRLFYYKPCYAPALSSRRPGKLIMAYMIRDAVERGLEEIDLLYGIESYKAAYASDVRRTGSLTVYRSRSRQIGARIGTRLSRMVGATRPPAVP